MGNNLTTLYFIKIKTEFGNEPQHLYKIGTTSLAIMQKYDEEDLKRIEVLKELKFPIDRQAQEAVKAIDGLLAKHKHKGIVGGYMILRSGDAEFIYDVNPIEFLRGLE